MTVSFTWGPNQGSFGPDWIQKASLERRLGMRAYNLGKLSAPFVEFEEVK